MQRSNACEADERITSWVSLSLRARTATLSSRAKASPVCREIGNSCGRGGDARGQWFGGGKEPRFQDSRDAPIRPIGTANSVCPALRLVTSTCPVPRPNGPPRIRLIRSAILPNLQVRREGPFAWEDHP